MRKLSILSIGVLVCGCVSQPQGYFHRISDGKRVDADPQLLAQFQVDRAICDGEASQAALTSNERDRMLHARNVNIVFDGCLAKRGYIRR